MNYSPSSATSSFKINSDNTGFLYNISEYPNQNAHLLLTEGFSVESALRTNTKAKEIFDRSNTIYLEYPDILSLEEKNIEILKGKWIELLNRIDSTDNQEIHTSLTKSIHQVLEKPAVEYAEMLIKKILEETGQKKNDLVSFVMYFFTFFRSNLGHIYGHLEQENVSQYLRSKGKEILYLNKYEDFFSHFIDASEDVLKNKKILSFLNNCFQKKETAEVFLKLISLSHQAWSRGDFQNYSESAVMVSKACPIPDLINQLQEHEAEELIELIKSIKIKLDNYTNNLIAGILESVLCKQDNIFVILRTSSTLAIEYLEKKSCKISLISTPTKPAGLFWKFISPDNHKGYLLGTMHVTPRELARFNSKIWKCFHKSEGLTAEVIPTKEILNQAKELLKKNTSPKGGFHSLKLTNKMQVLSTLRDFLIQQEIVPEEMMQGPNLDDPYEYLDDLYDYYHKLMHKKLFKDSGYTSGVEVEFLRAANDKKLPVISLETLEGHFDDFSFVNQSSQLEDDPLLAAHILKGDKDALSLEVAKWKKAFKKDLDYKAEPFIEGYLEKIEAMYRVKFQEGIKHSANRRNMRIALKIDELTSTGKRYFHMIGGAHFVGESGLIKLLSNMGYKLTRIISYEAL